MKNETVNAAEVRLAIDRIQDIAVLGIESTADTGQACSLIEHECMRLKSDLGIDGPLGRDEQGDDAAPSGSGATAEPAEPLADSKLSIGDRLDKLAGEAESNAAVAGMIAGYIAGGSGKGPLGPLYLCEREFYRIQETLNDIWEQWEREQNAAGGAA